MAKKAAWDAFRFDATITGRFLPSTRKSVVTAKPAAGTALLLVTQVESPFAPRNAAEVGLRGPGANRVFIVPAETAEAFAIGAKITALHDSRRVWWGNWKIDAVITAEGTAGEIPAGEVIGADKDGNDLTRYASYGVWTFATADKFAFLATEETAETDGETAETPAEGETVSA